MTVCSWQASFLPSFPAWPASAHSSISEGCQPALSRGIRGEGKCLEYLKRNDLPCRQDFVSFFFCCLSSFGKSETPRRGHSMHREGCVLPIFVAGRFLALTLCVLRETLALLPSASGATRGCCLMTGTTQQPSHLR